MTPEQVTGLFHALARIFKLGHRAVLRRVGPAVLPGVLAVGNGDLAQSVILRKLVVKVVQRIGVAFLPPRLPSWRYQRGAWSLNLLPPLSLTLPLPGRRAPVAIAKHGSRGRRAGHANQLQRPEPGAARAHPGTHYSHRQRQQ